MYNRQENQVEELIVTDFRRDRRVVAVRRGNHYPDFCPKNGSHRRLTAALIILGCAFSGRDSLASFNGFISESIERSDNWVPVILSGCAFK
ncbi:hypothetical protein R1flu_021855 [Riccia fluitans]|uniref:Uncharacterized protein n=1 Tax=Riccia fluitans TaxID=41844 RepID=A0ABD1ZR66_9MARC